MGILIFFSILWTFDDLYYIYSDNEYLISCFFVTLMLFLPFCIFTLRSIIFSKFFNSFKKKIYCFIPCFQFYFFSKELVDKKYDYMDSRFHTLIGSIICFLSYLYFIVTIILLTKIFPFMNEYFNTKFFAPIVATYTFRLTRFVFNLAYLEVLKTIYKTFIKSKFISFLICFSLLFFSEILSLVIIYWFHKKINLKKLSMNKNN